MQLRLIPLAMLVLFSFAIRGENCSAQSIDTAKVELFSTQHDQPAATSKDPADPSNKPQMVIQEREKTASENSPTPPPPDISQKAIKEMTGKLLANAVKEKAIALMEFTDGSGKITSESQRVFLNAEPVIVEEGNRLGVSFIERKDLKLILDEWALKSMVQADVVDPGAQVLLGADYILTGKVIVSEGQLLCTMKLVELLTGKILTSVSGKAHTVKATKAGSAPTPAKPPKTANNKSVSEDGKLSLWTLKNTFKIGEKMEIYFSVKEPLYVEIIDVTPLGEINKLFPNELQTDNYCLPGKVYRIPPGNGAFELLVTPPAGIDRVKAFASPTKMTENFAATTRGIQLTKKIIETTPTRTNLSITLQ